MSICRKGFSTRSAFLKVARLHRGGGPFAKDKPHGICQIIVRVVKLLFLGGFSWGRIWVRTCFHPGASGLARDETGLEGGRKVMEVDL